MVVVLSNPSPSCKFPRPMPLAPGAACPQPASMRLEHRSQPLAPRHRFLRRLAAYALAAALLIGVSLLIGVLGYHHLGGLGWIDALLNASMILGGMGPVDILAADGAKVFASLYALYSGVALLSTVSLLLTPVVHRVLHRMHLEGR